MEFKFNVTGQKRKELVTAMSEILGTSAKYLGAPAFAYEIGEYHIDKNGTVTGEHNLNLMVGLEARGFEYEASKSFHFITPRGTLLIRERFDTAAEAEAAGYGMYFTHEAHDVYVKPSGKGEHSKHFALVGEPFPKEEPKPAGPESPAAALDELVVDVPLDGFTPEVLDNLAKMVLAKEPLIKKALGAESLPIEVLEDRVSFLWFKAANGESVNAYSQFITALCNTAKAKKRVTAKAPEVFENERFAMRVWLIGLGMVGAEYKLARKLLMTPLSGNAAWRYGKPEKTPETETAAAASEEDAG